MYLLVSAMLWRLQARDFISVLFWLFLPLFWRSRNAFGHYFRRLKCFTENNEAIWTSTFQHIKAKIEIKEHLKTFVSASHFAEARRRFYGLISGGICLFVGSTLQFDFLPSKPCFSLKSVLLNSCYTEANQQCIGSFLADRCDQLINQRLVSATWSAVAPESELRPK